MSASFGERNPLTPCPEILLKSCGRELSQLFLQKISVQSAEAKSFVEWRGRQHGFCFGFHCEHMRENMGSKRGKWYGASCNIPSIQSRQSSALENTLLVFAIADMPWSVECSILEASRLRGQLYSPTSQPSYCLLQCRRTCPPGSCLDPGRPNQQAPFLATAIARLIRLSPEYFHIYMQCYLCR